MSGVNKVIILGRLGKDPEVRFMPNGGAVANLTVATSETWKDKQTGEQKEKTEWHRIAIFGKLAEIAGEYLKKGSKVYLEGSLQTRKWVNQQGQDQYTTEVVLKDFGGVLQMLDSKPQGQQQQGGYQQNNNQQQNNQQNNQQQNNQQQQGGFQQQNQQQNNNQGQQQRKNNNQQQSGQRQQQGHQQYHQQGQQQNQGGFQQQQQKVNPQEPDLSFDDDIPF